MSFDYNSTRSKLILAEYGRNVQNMVAHICSLPTKEERNRYAQVIIELMGFLNPHLRDVADFKHKLWDHLHIISNFMIDVDAPYPKPDANIMHKKPELLAYPQRPIRYKHYGKIIELMIEKAKKIQDSERQSSMAQGIANFMKLTYINWNKDAVADEIIINDLKELSNGCLILHEGTSLSKIDVRTPKPSRPRIVNQNNKVAKSNRNLNRPRNNTQNTKRHQ